MADLARGKRFRSRWKADLLGKVPSLKLDLARKGIAGPPNEWKARKGYEKSIAIAEIGAERQQGVWGERPPMNGRPGRDYK